MANIVPVPKKDGKVRICVDYRDLNRASLKDNFPLPYIDTLVDTMSKHSLFFFMDGFSGYNQIRMAPEDMENDDLPPDLLRLVEQEERQISPHQETTEAANLGTEEEKKEVKIGTTLSPATRKELIDLL